MKATTKNPPEAGFRFPARHASKVRSELNYAFCFFQASTFALLIAVSFSLL